MQGQYTSLWIVCVVCFFLQAEDGIRDLVRSRGLGDVYKRQLLDRDLGGRGPGNRRRAVENRHRHDPQHDHAVAAVSYTHLTLPTSDLV